MYYKKSLKNSRDGEEYILREEKDQDLVRIIA
jgi:hypothetical protein